MGTNLKPYIIQAQPDSAPVLQLFLVGNSQHFYPSEMVFKESVSYWNISVQQD